MLKKVSAILPAIGAFLAATVSAPAMAFTVTQNSDSNTLLNALLGDTTGLSGFTSTLSGDSSAFGLFFNGSDPFGIDSGVVLSTGNVEDLDGPNDSGSQSTNLPGSDSISWTIGFNNDSLIDGKLFFDFVFGSEEFLEYGGSVFNDSFSLSLNGINLAKLSDGLPVTINNLVSSPSGPYHPDYINNPVSALTELDGFTKVLSFQGSLNSGYNELVINIADVGDSAWDSAVLLKGSSFGSVPTEDVPEPVGVLGLLATAAIAIGRRVRMNLI